MKYKLINPPKMDILETVLFNRNIFNLEDYLNPPTESISPLLLDNMEIGVNVIRKHIDNNSKFCILIDCDADGLTSSVLMYLYLKQLGIEPFMVYHEGKVHGLNDKVCYDQILEFNPDILIIPDASSNEAELHNELIDKMDIIVLDHHESDNVLDSKAIIINNQTSPNFPNKNLSGVGIVYKFLQQLDSVYGINLVNAMLDLVAVGNVADLMDLNNLDTRYLVLEGLKQVYNPLFKEIMEQEKISSLTIMDIAFKISPLINAIIRIGTMDEKKMLFDALIGKDYTVTYKYQGKEKTQTVQQAVIRISKNCKSRQSRVVKKYTEELNKQILKSNLLENKVLILNTTDIFEIPQVSGLVATKIANEYKRPVLLLGQRSDTDMFGGSARSYGSLDFKEICSSSGLFIFTEGHKGAFGSSIKKENIYLLNDYFNEVLADTDLEVCHKVDYEIDIKNLRISHIATISDLSHLWGCFIDEPMFAITNITLKPHQLKKNGIVASFESNNISFIKNFASSSFVEEFTCGKERGFSNKDIKVDLICKFKKSNNKYFCEIVDYHSEVSQEIIF